MSIGTIHPITADLFGIEGGAISPAAAVYRWGDRVYLLTTGVGASQRSSIRAIAASFGTVDELVLVSADTSAQPGNNDDLLLTLPARRRRHLRGVREQGVVTPALVATGGHDELMEVQLPVYVGTTAYRGWELIEPCLQVLYLGGGDATAAVHIGETRTLLLTGRPELHLLSRETSEALSRLSETMHVVLPRSGPPLDHVSFAAMLSIVPASGNVMPALNGRESGT